MQNMRIITLVAAGVLGCAAPSFAQAPDLTGTWDVSFTGKKK